MKQLASYLPQTASKLDSRNELTASESTTTSSKGKRSASHADYIWWRMSTIYSNLWSSGHGDDSSSSTGREWNKALAGMSRQQIEAGFDACITSGDKFPPEIPEFRARCLGVLTVAEVLADRDRREPFTRRVWHYLDNHAYRQASAERGERMFREACEVAKAATLKGAPMPSPPTAARVEHQQRRPNPSSPEVAERHFNNIRQLFGRSGKDAAAGPDR